MSQRPPAPPAPPPPAAPPPPVAPPPPAPPSPHAPAPRTAGGRDGPPPGWLLRELPRPLAEDEFTGRFIRIFEDIGGGIRGRIDRFHRDLDPGVAAPEFLRWMAGWLGMALDPSLPEEHQRSLVRAAGPMFPLRGTKLGLQGLLEAFTQSKVEITDGGGVFGAGAAPAATNQVTIRVSSSGAISEQHLLELVQREVPATAVVDLRVGRRRVKESDEEQPDLNSTVEIALPGADTQPMDPAGRDDGSPGGTPPPPPGAVPPGT
jgi:phage tail-like protein